MQNFTVGAINISTGRPSYAVDPQAVLCLRAMEDQDIELFAEEVALLEALREKPITYPKKVCCVDWAASLIEYGLAEEDAKGMLKLTDAGRLGSKSRARVEAPITPTQERAAC